MIFKYLLKITSRTEKGTLLPAISPADIENSQIILSKERPLFDFLDANTLFSPLIPKYFGDGPNLNNSINEVGDISSWIENKPKGWMYPISLKFKNILDNFNMGECRFYTGEILINGEILPHYVMHVLPLEFTEKKYIDFSLTTFCNYKIGGKIKIGNEEVKVSSLSKLRQIRRDKKWQSWGYNKTFVKSSFSEIDLVRAYPYGLLISENLKDVIQDKCLKGMEISEEPIIFNIAKENA